VSIKLRQSVSAAIELAIEPFDVRAIVKFVDALSDWSVKKLLYQRMLADKSPELIEHLRRLSLEPVDLDALARLPANTFGARYAKFFRESGVTLNGQIDAYPEIRRVLAHDWMTCRFIKTHDMVHLLLGLGVDVPGEMGVQVFNFRNFREPYGGLAFLGLPFAILRYGKPLDTIAKMRVGWRLGGEADNVFFVALEDCFDRDLDELRVSLGIHRRRDAQ
jgi:ubiquinone biosynthesis protein Coq4